VCSLEITFGRINSIARLHDSLICMAHIPEEAATHSNICFMELGHNIVQDVICTQFVNV
jgi:hypothetical protein